MIIVAAISLGFLLFLSAALLADRVADEIVIIFFIVGVVLFLCGVAAGSAVILLKLLMALA